MCKEHPTQIAPDPHRTYVVIQPVWLKATLLIPPKRGAIAFLRGVTSTLSSDNCLTGHAEEYKPYLDLSSLVLLI